MSNILKTILAKKIRNFFSIKPSMFLIDFQKNNFSISDAFVWRTDKDFYTVFSYSDLLLYFYKKRRSQVEILFFDRNHKLIKKIKNNLNELSNKLIINSELLNGIQDYGTFYILHNHAENFNSIIRNSCYTGYSYKNQLPSYVHGNLPGAAMKNNSQNLVFGLGGKSFFFYQKYKVQNYYTHNDVEIFIINPCSSMIKLIINNKDKFELRKNNLIKYNLKKSDHLIEIKSNCYLLRPVIFEFSTDFIDVYHG
tara:strand:+ start:130 stop:885 length:756 start_codon:yes stop_codon:yes gene_type:complete